MDRETAIKNATAYAKEVCNVFSPFLIIMYGSHANGTQTHDSDIDVAVIFDGYSGNWLKDSSQLWKLTRNVSTDIEPVLLDKAKDPSGFVEDIMKTGEVLYSAIV